jgi:hypothetical protein
MKSQDTFDQLLSDHLKRTTPQIPHARYKLEAVKARIAADRAATVKTGLTETTQLGFGAWLKSLFAVGSPRHALALGVIAVQFAAIAGLALQANQRPEFSETRTASSGMVAPEKTNFIRLSFKSTATEAEIRKLLTAVQADIVAGPSQIGEYYLLTAQEQIAEHVATLKGSTVVEAANVVERLP